MNWLQHRLESWQALLAAAAAALAAAFSLFKLLPRVFRKAQELCEGAAFMLDVKEHIDGSETRLVDKLNGLEARLFEKLSSLDDGQLNMIVVRRKMLDNDPDIAYFETTPQGSTYWVSKAWVRWTGLDNDEARGHGWENGVDPKDLARVLTNWQLALDHQRECQDEFSYVDRDGNRTAVECSVKPIFRKDGSIISYFGSSRRKDAEGNRWAANALAAAAPTK